MGNGFSKDECERQRRDESEKINAERRRRDEQDQNIKAMVFQLFFKDFFVSNQSFRRSRYLILINYVVNVE